MTKTGATRYQKFLKSEKAKTKLKAKRDLPKGTNVTKTNFKIKKITIREQLKKHGEHEALSSRKLNIKELLSRLNHFNTQSRTDALGGLMELITSHPEVLEQNLGQLIHGITPMILNIERVVRRESLKILHFILSNVSAQKIEPFFDIASTYLRSAMTHIDNRIQEDSLLFLDILLLCTSERMAQDFHKLIPNFLDMISKLRVNSKPERTLTINLDNQVTTVKWRVKVLQRLQDFLQKFVEYHKINDNDETVVNMSQIFDNTKLNHFNLFNPNYTSVCNVSCFSSKNHQNTIVMDESEKFITYIETLMPLLFEIWLEVCPNMNAGNNIETVVSEDAAILLRHILKIISLIWHLIRYFKLKNSNYVLEKMFLQKYRQLFNQHIVNSFPYVTNVRTKQNKTNDTPFVDQITDQKLVTENLEISRLFILLNPYINVKSQNKEIGSVLRYIEKIFNQNTQDSVNDDVINILQTLFSYEVTSWTKTVSVIDALFRKIIWAYCNKTISNDFRQKLFNLLCKIALNDTLHHFRSTDVYEVWMKNLPDILLEKSITVQTIDMLHKFAVRNNNDFNTIVKDKLLGIVKNLPIIVISDAVNETYSYHKLFSLLFWIKFWDNESLNLLEKQLLDNTYHSDYCKYIFDTLKLKSGNMS